MRKATIVTLLFVLSIQGCAFLGIDFSDDRTIAIQKSPYLITVDGDIEKYDYVFVNNVLSHLDRQAFQDDNFTAWKINVSDITTINKTTIHNTGGDDDGTNSVSDD
jgi:hypothetical protein